MLMVFSCKKNYMYYTMMGGPIRLKPGVRPHKFDCQGKMTPHNESKENLKRKMSILKILSSVENIMEADQRSYSKFIVCTRCGI